MIAHLPLPPALVALGWSDHWSDQVGAVAARGSWPGAEPGRVVRHDGVAVLVTTAAGTAQRPVQASVEPVPVVGDWVLATDDAVVAVLPRSSLLRRRDAMRDVEHPLVANVDVVLVALGLDRPRRTGRAQRAITMARDAGAEPLIVLTKADQAADVDGEVAAARADNPRVDVIAASTRTGRGLDELRRRATGHTLVLIGESGAGKSTLTNALVGAEVAATGAVRDRDGKGRHTTTARQIHLLPSGGVLVDTPGIRSVGLWTDTEAVDATFDDVELTAQECHFSNCGHGGEPGCAVALAVAGGELDPARVAAWELLREEAEEATRQAEARARTQAARRPSPPPDADPSRSPRHRRRRR